AYKARPPAVEHSSFARLLRHRSAQRHQEANLELFQDHVERFRIRFAMASAEDDPTGVGLCSGLSFAHLPTAAAVAIAIAAVILRRADSSAAQAHRFCCLSNLPSYAGCEHRRVPTWRRCVIR